LVKSDIDEHENEEDLDPEDEDEVDENPKCANSTPIHVRVLPRQPKALNHSCREPPQKTNTKSGGTPQHNMIVIVGAIKHVQGVAQNTARKIKQE
jgi:hypothetical protein